MGIGAVIIGDRCLGRLGLEHNCPPTSHSRCPAAGQRIAGWNPGVDFCAMRTRMLGVLLCALAAAVTLVAHQQPAPAANVLVVTMDGMRWQEVFGGLSSDLLTKEGGGVSEAAAKE